MSSIRMVKRGAEHMEHTHEGNSLSLMVHIRSYSSRIARGTFLTLPDRVRYEFYGLDQMLLMVEDIMDRACGPEAVSGHRYLYRESYTFRNPAYPPAEKASGNAVCLSGEKVTFILQVCCRRNRSMQGRLTVQMEQKQESISFRSSLELLRLMHEYLGRELQKQEGRTGS